LPGRPCRRRPWHREFGKAFVTPTADRLPLPGRAGSPAGNRTGLDEPRRPCVEDRPRLSGLRHLAQRALRHHRRPRAPLLRRAVPPRGAPHPEGRESFTRISSKLAGFKGDWTMGAYREEAIRKIREQVGDAKVICGLSGGVELGRRRPDPRGDRRPADLRLRRPRPVAAGRGEQVVTMFRDHYNMPLIHADEIRPVPRRAGRRFRPRGQAQDHRRLFIDVFQKHANEIGGASSWRRARFTPT
jgi:GMP synthase (glutamine-hydrolysing)